LITKKILDSKPKPKKIALSFLYPLIVLFYYLKHLFTKPIMRAGINGITGDTGGGKSILASIIAKKWHDKGFTVYSNSKFNSVIKEIKITDYFDDFEIKKELKNGIVIFDEIQRDFNKRQNRKNEYNEVFIPLIEWLTTHRHNGIIAVYFVTQSWDRLDTQLQDLIARIHFVWSRPKTIFKVWLRTDGIKPTLAPKAIQYVSRKRKDIHKSDYQRYVKKGEIKHKPLKKYKELIPLTEYADFDTHAFKNSKIMKKESAKKN